MNKVIFQPYVKVGSLELNRMQDLLNGNTQKMVEPLLDNAGLLIKRDLQGNLLSDWLVSIYTVRSIKVNSGKAYIYDNNNNLTSLILKQDAILETPLTDGTYKVVLRHAYNNYEEGTITLLNNSKTVQGNGTKFSQVLGVNRRIYADGKFFVVSNVISDTEAEISEVYTGASINNARYIVGGYFSEYPLTAEHNFIYLNESVSIVITNGDLQPNDIMLANITVTNGWVVSVEDKREQIVNVYEQYPQLNHTNLRDRKVTLYRSSFFANGTDAAITDLFSAEILATDSHSTEYQTKLRLSFYKGQDDTTLSIAFTPRYTDTGGVLSQVDQTKFRLQAVVGSIVAETYLDANLLTCNISQLANGYYTLELKLKKVAAAFNLSLRIDEIYLTGGNTFIV